MVVRWLRYPSVQIALCTLACAAIAWRMSAFGILMTGVAWAIVIARPVINLVANAQYNVRAAAWRPVQGKFFSYKGVALRVVEDEDHCRWIHLADARRVAPGISAERVLVAAYPGRVRRMGQPEAAHVRDDALVEHLGKAMDGSALRFRTWIDRDIAFPAAKERKRLGIHPEPPFSS